MVSTSEGAIERCRAAADRLAVLREEETAEKERRDKLVVELRDSGMSWRDVAAAARLSITQCVTIVAEFGSPIELGELPA